MAGISQNRLGAGVSTRWRKDVVDAQSASVFSQQCKSVDGAQCTWLLSAGARSSGHRHTGDSGRDTGDMVCEEGVGAS